MIKIENLEVWGFRGAIRGMRNPMNSWDKIDTTFDEHGNVIKLGSNDGSLMLRLKVAGPDHRKYLRMIHIQCDVTAPLYWWKDYDTYKVSTVANSCSTMHPELMTSNPQPKPYHNFPAIHIFSVQAKK